MDTNIQPVNQKDPTAGAGQPTGALPSGDQKPALAPEADPTVQLAALLEKNKKLEEQRDGLEVALKIAKQKNKKKVTESDDDEEDLEPSDLAQLVAKTVKEQLASTEAMQAQRELEELAKRQAQELKEAKLALAQATTLPTTPVSAGAGEPSVLPKKDAYFSDEQIKYMREVKGFSDKQIEEVKQNLLKYV